MAITPLITIEQAREQLNFDASADDAEIYDALVSATEIINNRKGYTAPTPFVEVVNVTGQADAFGWPIIMVARTPVLSVESIVRREDDQVLDVSHLEINTEAGLLTLRGALGIIGSLLVSYTAGRTEVPQPLQQACKFITQWLWDTQRGGDTVAPGFGEEDAGAPDMGLPYQALVLLDETPYSAAPGFA